MRPAYLALLFLLSFLMTFCSGEPPVPKPRAYPKVDFPDRIPATFSAEVCPFSFSMYNYATMQQTTRFFDGEPEHPCWFDLNMEIFNAALHFSYKSLREHHIDQLLQDDHKLVHTHTVKAHFITDYPVVNSSGTAEGFVYRIDGPVASPLQFYITDSENHFLRASLYFNVAPQPDSLQPVVDFITEDVFTLIESIEWQ